MKYFRTLTIIVGWGPVAVGCATLPPQETAYQQRFMAQPITFDVPKKKADEAWARALNFVNDYSNMAIEITTDTMIKTYLPSIGKYGYRMMRTNVGDNVKFVVNCLAEANNGLGLIDPISSNNAHIAALYIAQGVEPVSGTLDGCFRVSCK